MVVEALVVTLKDHDGPKKYLTDSVTSGAERSTAEYAANVQDGQP